MPKNICVKNIYTVFIKSFFQPEYLLFIYDL